MSGLKPSMVCDMDVEIGACTRPAAELLMQHLDEGVGADRQHEIEPDRLGRRGRHSAGELSRRCSRAAGRSRSRSRGCAPRTPARLLRTRSTVAADTPASRATSIECGAHDRLTLAGVDLLRPSWRAEEAAGRSGDVPNSGSAKMYGRARRRASPSEGSPGPRPSNAAWLLSQSKSSICLGSFQAILMLQRRSSND